MVAVLYSNGSTLEYVNLLMRSSQLANRSELNVNV